MVDGKNLKGSPLLEVPAFSVEKAQQQYQIYFPKLSDEIRSQLLLIHSEVLNFNGSAGLVPAPALQNFAHLHLCDCVLAAGLIEGEFVGDDPVYDAGTGNGLPGLISAVLFKKRVFKILERDEKKIGFLKAVVKAVKLTNVELVPRSVEELEEQSVRNLLTRGPIQLSKTLFAARKSVAKKGRFFHLKSDSWSSELVSVPSQLLSVWSPRLLGQYRLPDSGVQMAVIVTEKIV